LGNIENRRTALLAAANSWAGLPDPTPALDAEFERFDLIIREAQFYLDWLEERGEYAPDVALDAGLDTGLNASVSGPDVSWPQEGSGTS